MPETEYLTGPDVATGYIYLITNTINNKQYVGQTTQSLERRWSNHVAQRTDPNHWASLLHKAIRKYGAQHFLINTLEIVQGKNVLSRLNLLEPMYIALCGTLAPAGYNLDSGGKNKTVHAHTRAKLSAAGKGRVSNRKGSTASPETRAKLSLARKGKKGKPLSAAHRAAVSAARKGKTPWNKGLHLSAETKAKISKAVKANQHWVGRKHSEESKQKMSATKQANRLRRTSVQGQRSNPVSQRNLFD